MMGDPTPKPLKARLKEPLASLTVQAEVYGLYSFPEAWLQAEGDFDYSLSVCGVKFSGGHIMKREPTEEELKAVEQSKKKQPAAAKGKPVEPTPEEIEAQERERKAREEAEAKRKAEWDALTEDERYYRTKEDIHQHAFLLWDKESEGDDRKFKTVTLEKVHAEEELVILEEQISDEGGVLLEFSKTPPAVEEDPKKKAKAKPGEEAKPVFAQAWVDMTYFRSPAAQETTFRVQLQDPTPRPDQPADPPLFNSIRCYVYFRLRLDPPVTPSLPSTPYTTLAELVPPKPPLPKYAPSVDGSHDFRRQIKLAAQGMALEYYEKYREGLDQDSRRFSASQQKETREKWKQDFLYEMNLSGRAHVLKEKLTKSIMKIAREKYGSEESLKGLSFDKKDKVFSELYAYLVGQYRVSKQSLVAEKREELKEDLTVTPSLMVRDKEKLLAQTTEETSDQRLTRLVAEYELAGDSVQAEQYLQQRVNSQKRNSAVWLDYARFSLQHGDMAKAQESLQEVIALSGQDVTAEQLLLFGSVSLESGSIEEARFYLHSALDKDRDNVLTNLITSLLYFLQGQESLYKKYLAISKRLTQRHLGLLPPCKGFESMPNPSLQSAHFREQPGPNSTLSQDQTDDLYYVILDYFLEQRLLQLALRTADFITAKETSIVKYSFSLAAVQYWKGDYAASCEALKQLLELKPRSLEGWSLLGHSHFQLNSHADAEECYLKALRCAAKSGVSVESAVRQRLGQIYLQRQSWKDAWLVFKQCCEESPSAFAWQGLGYACLRLSLYEDAEQALSQANVLDDCNASTWLYLGLLCLYTTTTPPGRYIQARQCFVQALKFGASDPRLWQEVGNLHIAKFFLEGTGPSSNKQDVVEALHYYQLSLQILATQGTPVDGVALSIASTFEGLKDIGDNRLDQGLMQLIDEKEAEVLQACGLEAALT